jgi:hypothetical protein
LSWFDLNVRVCSVATAEVVIAPPTDLSGSEIPAERPAPREAFLFSKARATWALGLVAAA